jgi:8-oxo-dGTP pyrophosphatase MutT (NUDIX family)
VSGDEPIDRNRAIQRVRDHRVYANRFVTVYDDEVLFPPGRLGRYVRVVESHGRQGVAVLAECAGRFALVRTYRYPLGQWEWGVPRGMGAADTDPVATAQTELVEELGGAPLSLCPMGLVTPSSGLLCTQVNLFYAMYEQPVAQPQDIDEVLSVQWIDLPGLLEEIATCRIVDGFTMSAVTAALAHGLIRL